MKKILAGAILTMGAVFTAHADEAAPFKFLLGAGVTFGGDTLATVHYTDGSSEDIKGGGLLMLYGGAEYRLGTQVSIQATVGYHVDDTSTRSNGSVRFTRVPVDLLAFFHVNDKVRLGGGVQWVNGPELKGSGAASGLNAKFDDTTGAVIEGEYLFSPHAGFKLRYVSEEFKVKGTNTKADGNHIGLMFNYYF